MTAAVLGLHNGLVGILYLREVSFGLSIFGGHLVLYVDMGQGRRRGLRMLPSLLSGMRSLAIYHSIKTSNDSPNTKIK